MMIKNRYVYLNLFLVTGIILSNCARKAAPTAVEEAYREDLTSTLPDIDPYASPVIDREEEEQVAFKEPRLDITDGLEVTLDSIASINKNLPYLRYTVLVHNSNSRNDAEEARKDVFRVMPDAKPKLQFISPSYIVKVGDFFDRLEAYQTLVKLKKQFPNAIIIPEQVYIE